MNDLIGQHLGPYRVLEQIGIGGMATVYKAYQPAMDRYVAVKVIAAHFAQEETFLKRFRREAQAVAKLEHAHILPVYDSGEAEGRPYLVMRYLEAGTLKDRMIKGPLPLTEVNHVIGQVGSALDYAHRMGVVHRDVKPSNILLDAEGDTFLTDFGLAKMMEASAQLTGTGVGVGTPAYMSPEQGKGAKVDSRADIYSLGVMLYEMVTGRAPYEAETPLAVVLKHIQEPLPLPHSVRSDLPEEVERVILRAMAKDPDDRFQTAGEMVRALDAAVRASEAAARTEPAAPAARMEPAVTEEATESAEGVLARTVAGVRQVLPVGWGRTAAWGAGGIVALLILYLALSRVPLRVQINGGQLEVVRMAEETVTPVEPLRTQPPATVTPTPVPMETTTVPVVTPPSSPTADLPPTALLYTSSGKRTENFYPSAGGTSCCGCRDRNYGNLPEDFTTGDVSAVTFYLTTSREDSYYTRVKSGSSALTLVLGDRESTATSTKVPNGQEMPVEASWLVTFEFDPPVRAMPGLKWQLLDGDDNIYSNVWPHSSDIDREGLPGTLEISDCQYAGTTDVWYSVKFDLVPSDTEPIPVTDTSPADQAHAFAEPILAAIVDRTPDYEDDFSNPRSGWPIGPHPDGGERGYKDGVYDILAQYDHGVGVWPDPEVWFSDLVLEVDAQFVSGEWGNWGVIFRKWPGTVEQPGNAQYSVSFYPDGAFDVGKSVDNVHMDLGYSGHAPTFEQGFETNHLTIIARGPQIAFYVNGEPLWFVYDESSSRGTMELCAASLIDNATLQVQFDNLRIWDITDLPLPSAETTPAPAGECRIAYYDQDDIYVRNCDGSDVRRLTDHPAWDVEPAFSPDGQHIVFQSERDCDPTAEERTPCASLYIVDVDGSNLMRLTNGDNNNVGPTWSPDGSRIAFHRNCDLATISPDGSNLWLWQSDVCIENPAWSPDGQRLAFGGFLTSAFPGDRYRDIYIINSDGTNLVKLARFEAPGGVRTIWSPDGQKIGVQIDEHEKFGAHPYYLLNADGSGEPAEVESIPDSWYHWYWPQWGSGG